MGGFDETKVVPSGLPLFLEGTNGKAVLIIHGYTGYPGEMYGLARFLNGAGFSVAVPRLPGHATCAADFVKTRGRDWFAHVRNAYLDLQARYGTVSVVGLSMGGVLSLLLASYFSPERVVLLAPAMAIRDKAFRLSPFLKYFIRTSPKDWKPEADASADVRYLGKEYWSVTRVPMVAELRALQRMAIGRLSLVRCPVLVMVSEKDKTVPLEAAETIRNGLSADTKMDLLVLKESPHVLVSGPEKDTVFARTLAWLG